MEIKFDYKTEALMTESHMSKSISNRLSSCKIQRLLHASIGLTTEIGEFADALKKYIFYSKDLDEINLKEEIGDIFWYIAIAIDALGESFDSIQVKNIAKLRKRYGGKFSKENALNRNLKAEREEIA
jgi:NTP pyrophosphatase (non-canonical NTP hydrolase)